MNSLDFWSTMTGHVFSWPVAVVLVVLILKRPLGGLLRRLLSFEGPGEIKATFSDVIEDSGIEVIEAGVDVERKDPPPRSPDGRADLRSRSADDDIPPTPERVEVHPAPAIGRGSASSPRADASDSLIAPNLDHLLSTLSLLGNWDRQVRRRSDDLRLEARLHPARTIVQAWRMVYEFLELACAVVTESEEPHTLRNMIDTLIGAGVLATKQARDIGTLNRLREIAKQGDGIELDASGALEYITLARGVIDQGVTSLQSWAVGRSKATTTPESSDPPTN